MLLQALLLVACCAAARAQTSKNPKQVAVHSGVCGVSEAQADNLWTPGAKIVGGVKAAENSWPWICALIKNKPGYYPYQFCGATIIASHWIITASHCVDSQSEAEMIQRVQVVCGTNDLRLGYYVMPDKFVYNITRKIMHEDYDKPEGSTNNDVALLKLSRPITYGPNIQPACLPTGPMEDHRRAANIDRENGNRRVAFVAGWGHLNEHQEQGDINDPSSPKVGAGSDVLQQVNIDLYSFPECKKKLREYEYTDRMACGGFEEGGKDSCQGDSGGPLISKNSQGFWELIGVVSWGAGCARAGMPGIYANLWALKDWIVHKVSTN